MKHQAVSLIIPIVLVGCASAVYDEHRMSPHDPPLDPECEQYTYEPSIYYPTEFPVNILLDSRISAHNRGLMLGAIDIWNQRMDMEVVYATISSDLKMHDECNYAVVTDTVDLDPQWIGMTNYGKCASDIVNIETMDTKMAMGNDPAYYTDDLVLNVTIHEIGHVLGLDHETDRNSVMFKSIGPGDERYISEQSYCLVQKAVAHTTQ